MVASRQSSSPAGSSAVDALDDLIADLSTATTLSSPSVGSVPPSSGPRPPRPPAVVPPAPMSSSTVAPLSATSSGSGGVSQVRGHTNGKELLLHVDGSMIGTMCCAFLGGPSGSRSRFCCKRVSPGLMQFCEITAHKTEKYRIKAGNYYIRMKDESALCEPFVTKEELTRFDSLHLARAQHDSREWIAIIQDFHDTHGSRGDRFFDPLSSPEMATPRLGSAGGIGSAFGKPIGSGVGSGIPLDVDSGGLGVDEAVSNLAEDIFTPIRAFRASSARVTISNLLTGSGLDALKYLLPLGAGREDSAIPEGDESSLPEEARSESFKAVVASVESLLDTVPKGLNELDEKFSGSVRLIEDELNKIRGVHSTMQQDLFGVTSPSEFLGRYQSFAKALETLSAEIQGVSQRAAEEREEAETFDARVVAVEADVAALGKTLGEVSGKMTVAVKGVYQKATAHVTVLAERVGRLELLGSGVHGASPASDATLYFAAYTREDPRRVTGGRTVADYNRLVNEGWTLTHCFDSDGDMRDWIVSQQAVSVLTPTVGSSSGLANTTSQERVDLLQQLLDLRQEVAELKRNTQSAGVRVGNVSFDSIDEIVALIQEEGINCGMLAFTTDAHSYFSHHMSGSINDAKQTAEVKLMRANGINDIPSHRYLNSFRELQPAFFQNSSRMVVEEGDRFPMLANRVAWEGQHGFEGGRKKLERALTEILKSGNNYFVQHLPSGRFQNLALLCHMDSNAFWTRMVAHINSEVQTVSQYGIPETETFTLVSSELRVIFKALWEVRMLMQEFSPDRDKVLFLARLVWTTMKAHMIMQDFLEPGFGSHVLISGVFVRFLAEATGSSLAGGIESTINKLQEEIKTLDSTFNKVKKAMNSRMDHLTDNVKKLCTKADVKYVAFNARVD